MATKKQPATPPETVRVRLLEDNLRGKAGEVIEVSPRRAQIWAEGQVAERV